MIEGELRIKGRNEVQRMHAAKDYSCAGNQRKSVFLDAINNAIRQNTNKVILSG